MIYCEGDGEVIRTSTSPHLMFCSLTAGELIYNTSTYIPHTETFVSDMGPQLRGDEIK